MHNYKKKLNNSCICRILSFIVLILFVTNLNGCSFFRKSIRTSEEEQQVFEKFCNEEFRDTLQNDSFMINFMLKNPSNYGIDTNKVNIQDEYQEESNENEQVLDKLNTFDYDLLSEEQKVTYDTLKEYLEIQLKFRNLPNLNNIFSPSQGIIANISSNYVEYIIEDKNDAEKYIELVKAFKDYIDNALEYTRKQSQDGYFMTDYSADKVISMCQIFLDQNENPYISSYDKKVDLLDDISLIEKEKLKKANEEAVKDYINVSYKNVIDTLNELKGTCKNNEGLCHYKDGKKYYKALLRATTGTDKAMWRIILDIESNLDDCAYIISNSSVDTSTNKDLLGTNESIDGKPNNIINFLKNNVDKYYPSISDTNYYVDYQDKALEVDGVLAYYMTSRIDDWKDNHIKINSSEIQDDTELLYTTLAHESYPGHLYQHTYFCQNNPNPIRFLTENLGYAEGWAEYSADSAYDLLDLDSETIEYLKAVNFANSLLYTRMDIGINYEGWDVEDTEDFLENYGIDDVDVKGEFYDDIVANPGIMLPYTIGKIEMINLKDMAQDKLENNFDVKEFNKTILDTGNVPFDILEKEVKKYIDRNK